MKPYYDRTRRIKKRFKIGGMLCGEELPVIYRTWGQMQVAKRKGKELADFFRNPYTD